MSFPSEWGPYPFSIDLDSTPRTITLTQSGNSCPNAPSGTTPYTVSIAREGSSGSERGTVMLDDDGEIKAFCNPNRHKSWGYNLTDMTGKFNAGGTSTDGNWTGEQTTTTEGTWSAGGSKEPFPQQGQKRASA
jgi:hypothetical protein